MTEDEITELVNRLRGLLYMSNQAPPAYLTAIEKAADAIESLRADVANAERRAEDAEARNVFLETDIAALAEKVKK